MVYAFQPNEIYCHTWTIKKVMQLISESSFGINETLAWSFSMSSFKLHSYNFHAKYQSHVLQAIEISDYVLV